MGHIAVFLDSDRHVSLKPNTCAHFKLQEDHLSLGSMSGIVECELIFRKRLS